MRTHDPEGLRIEFDLMRILGEQKRLRAWGSRFSQSLAILRTAT